MKIHQIRNATIVIESKDKFILVDPMLGEKGSLPAFSKKRFEAKKNPIVDLPEYADSILEKVTHCLITHSHTFGLKALQHTDHIDSAGEEFLKKGNIPVVCRNEDVKYLKKLGLNVIQGLKAWVKEDLIDCNITAVPAKHGHGWISKMMANGIGFYIEFPNEPSVYISGDTVFTNDIQKALKDLKPDIAVTACGSAQLDVGGPILMPLEEIIEYIRQAPGKVIANHMEALNHCPTTRTKLKEALNSEGLLDKVMIPLDGETMEIAS